MSNLSEQIKEIIYEQQEKGETGLSGVIRLANEWDECYQMSLTGLRGQGKTTYVSLAGYEFYKDWKKVNQYLFFDFTEAIPIFERAVAEKKTIPYVIFDDAGHWLSKYLIWSKGGFKKTKALQGFFNLIRGLCKFVVFTSVTSDLLKAISEKDIIKGKVEVEGRTKPYKIARAENYVLDFEVYGHEWWEPTWYDRFECYMDKEFKEIYDERKRSALKQSLEDVKEAYKVEMRLLDVKEQLDCCIAFKYWVKANFSYHKAGSLLREEKGWTESQTHQQTIKNLVIKHLEHTLLLSNE